MCIISGKIKKLSILLLQDYKSVNYKTAIKSANQCKIPIIKWKIGNKVTEDGNWFQTTRKGVEFIQQIFKIVGKACLEVCKQVLSNNS